MARDLKGFALADQGFALARLRLEISRRAPLTAGLPFALISLLAALVMVVALRRLSGAIAQPASPLLLAAAGLMALLWTMLTIASLPPAARVRQSALLCVLAAVLIAWGAALSISGSSAWGMLLLWLFVMAGVAGIAFQQIKPVRNPVVRNQKGWMLPGVVRRELDAESRFDWQEVAQQTRIRTSQQGETVQGWLLADFAAGQRLVVAHIAFCPPFVTIPEVVAATVPADGAPARVRVTQVLHGGARLEIKRTGPVERGQFVKLEYTVADGPRQPKPSVHA